MIGDLLHNIFIAERELEKHMVVTVDYKKVIHHDKQARKELKRIAKDAKIERRLPSDYVPVAGSIADILDYRGLITEIISTNVPGTIIRYRYDNIIVLDDSCYLLIASVPFAIKLKLREGVDGPELYYDMAGWQKISWLRFFARGVEKQFCRLYALSKYYKANRGKVYGIVS